MVSFRSDFAPSRFPVCNKFALFKKNTFHFKVYNLLHILKLYGYNEGYLDLLQLKIMIAVKMG